MEWNFLEQEHHGDLTDRSRGVSTGGRNVGSDVGVVGGGRWRHAIGEFSNCRTLALMNFYTSGIKTYRISSRACPCPSLPPPAWWRGREVGSLVRTFCWWLLGENSRSGKREKILYSENSRRKARRLGAGTHAVKSGRCPKSRCCRRTRLLRLPEGLPWISGSDRADDIPILRHTCLNQTPSLELGNRILDFSRFG